MALAKRGLLEQPLSRRNDPRRLMSQIILAILSAFLPLLNPVTV